MDTLLNDPASPGLLPALEANMVAFWKSYGRAPGRELVEGGDLTRVMTGLPFPLLNGVFQAHLSAEALEPAIQATRAAVDAWQVPLFWWVGPTAQPDDLGHHLQAHGFVHAGDTPGMAIDLLALADDHPVPADFTIRPVKDEVTLETWARVAAIGTGFPASILEEFVSLELGVGFGRGTALRRYLGFQGGTPVTSSAMILDAGVAGIYAVATLPAARRHGLGAAMTVRPLLEARAQGYQVGTLQASELGYPIYRRLGFRDVCRFGLYFIEPASRL